MSQCAFLHHAEELEKLAASLRVAYYERRLRPSPNRSPRLLDVGCGNGYAVAEWKEGGMRAVGIDCSLYRLSRWVAENRESLHLLVADAQQLPFRSGCFSAVVSSGMIEHIGVDETSRPYTAKAHATQCSQRSTAIAEMLRVATDGKQVLIDCPNGGFPIDFWHGDRIGSFRLHGVPDELNPTWGQLRRWASEAGAGIRLIPVAGRLSFRQIANRWWGKPLLPLAWILLGICDLLTRLKLFRVAALIQPYLVVQIISVPAQNLEGRGDAA